MSLINCSECNNEISSAAKSCPSCGHPVNKTDNSVRPIVASQIEDRSEVPKWVIPVLIGVAAMALFGVLYAMQNPAEPQDQDLLVAAETERASEPADTVIKKRVGSTDTVPESSTVGSPVTENDQTVSPDTKTQVTSEQSTLGTVQIEARVSNSKGDVSPVEDEKFYLLNKELSEILSDANLKPIDGQTLVNSFGMSVLYPDRFSEFNEKALSAINDHIKYDTLTSRKGEAKISSVRPGAYYLFGIHRVGEKGFAVWSSPVTIKAGINNLNVRPQRAVELDAKSAY